MLVDILIAQMFSNRSSIRLKFSDMEQIIIEKRFENRIAQIRAEQMFEQMNSTLERMKAQVELPPSD